MSKKKMLKKPRSQYVTLDFGEAVSINSVFYDSAFGLIRLFKDDVHSIPKQALVEHCYDRPKGLKVLARAIASPDSVLCDVNLVLGRFDELYAVDTNTKIVRGESISVSGIVGGIPRPHGQYVLCHYRPIQCIEYRNITASPEKVGWWETLQSICSASQFSASKQYGVIVDAYLGELESINDRCQPVFRDFYLPANISLIYASSDTQNETVANKMLALADSIATTILSGLEADPPAESPDEVEKMPYLARRYWQMKAEP